MTQRTRQAIIHYWLSKHASYWRRPMRFLVLFLFSSTLLSEPSFAVEAKTKQPSGLIKLLDSKVVALTKAKEKEKAEKAKKKVVLPEPNAEDMKDEAEAKEVEGTVVARNNSGMAIEYEFDPVTASSKEIWLNFHSKVKVTGIRSLFDLRENDRVRASYKVTKKSKHLLLDKVAFLGKKPVEPVAAQPEEVGQ